jgi:hypothetical protein
MDGGGLGLLSVTLEEAQNSPIDKLSRDDLLVLCVLREADVLAKK